RAGKTEPSQVLLRADYRQPRLRTPEACWRICCIRAVAQSLRSDQSRVQHQDATWECERRTPPARSVLESTQTPTASGLRESYAFQCCHPECAGPEMSAAL